MKKSILPLFAVAALSIASCSSPSAYQVDGTVSDTTLNGRTLYMSVVPTEEIIDSTQVIDGKFQFKGAVDTVKMIRLLDDAQSYVMDFILEPGKIALELGETEKRSGTPLNDAYATFRDDIDSIRTLIVTKRQAIMESGMTSEEMEKEWGTFQTDVLTPTVNAIMTKTFDNNRDNIVGALAITSWDLEPAQLDSVLNLAGEKLKATPFVSELIKQQNILKKTAEGQMFTDFTIEQPDGSKVSLSDYVGKGKYVLVDFWASWCGPCRREIPNIKELYDKYHGDKFEVLGVAVRDEVEDTQKAIEELGIKWPQILNAQHIPTDLYAIRGIPHIILFAPDGTIVARDLREQAMKDKVAEVMAK